MQNWVDNQQMRVPGFRDRVVHVSHNKNEGGLNLNMPGPVLGKLSERGRQAGRRLVRFYTLDRDQDTDPPDCPDPEDDPTEPLERTVGWRNHRWVRLRSTLGLVEGMLLGMRRSYTADPAHPYRADLNGVGDTLDAPSYDWRRRAQRPG